MCKEGPFKGQVCADLSGRALIGSEESKPVLGRYEATFPDHHHPHTHTTQPHSHSFQQHERKQSNQYLNNEEKWLIRRWFEEQTSKETVIVDAATNLGVDLASLGTYDHPKASFGDLYPRHMRVEYIFKCF